LHQIPGQQKKEAVVKEGLKIEDSTRRIENAIRDKLKHPVGKLEDAAVKGIRKIKLKNQGLVNLSMIGELLLGLRNLDLSENAISDLGPLANLEHLEKLKLVTNQISDLAPLAELTELERLYLNGNQISDLSPLARLDDLEILCLNACGISDLSHLVQLTDLEELQLSTNQVVNLSPLESLNDLKELNLNTNQIKDIRPLAKLTDLKVLKLSNNRVRDIRPLFKLRNLEAVWLKGNNLIDPEQLKELCETLPACDVHHELLAVKDGPDSERMSLENPSESSDLPIISYIKEQYGEDFPSIQRLYLHEQSLDSIEFMNDCQFSSVESLDLDDNQITSLIPLSNCKKLKSLSLNNNQVSDLTPLAELEELEILEIQNNMVRDLSPLGNLKSLRQLCIQNNLISDRSSIGDLPNLENIFDRGNPREENLEHSAPRASISHEQFVQFIADKTDFPLRLVKLETTLSEEMGLNDEAIEKLRNDINLQWGVSIAIEELTEDFTCEELYNHLIQLINGGLAESDNEEPVAEDEVTAEGEATAEEGAHERQLIAAIQSGDAMAVRAAIEAGAPANVDSDEYPVDTVENDWGGMDALNPLEYSVLKNQKEISRILLEANARVGGWHDSSVKIAFNNERREILTLLSEYCDPPQWQEELTSLFSKEVLAGNQTNIEILVSAGLELNQKSNHEKLPLSKATENGNKEIIDFLIDRGADINAEQDEAVYSALRAGRGDIAEYLIGKGAMLERRLDELKKIKAEADSPTVIKLLEAKGVPLMDSPTEWHEALAELGGTQKETESEQESLEQNFLEVVANRLGYQADKVTLESHFKDDLDLEFVDLEDLRLDINKRWHVNISDKQAQQAATCRDLFGLLSAQLVDADIHGEDDGLESDETDDDGQGGGSDEPDDDSPAGCGIEVAQLDTEREGEEPLPANSTESSIESTNPTSMPPPLPKDLDAQSTNPPYPPLPHSERVEEEIKEVHGANEKIEDKSPLAPPPMSVPTTRPGAPMGLSNSEVRPVPLKVNLPIGRDAASSGETEEKTIELSSSKAQDLVDRRSDQASENEA